MVFVWRAQLDAKHVLIAQFAQSASLCTIWSQTDAKPALLVALFALFRQVTLVQPALMATI
jgi:hypothetical protein